MGRARRPVRLPDDIDSCAALAGELLAAAEALRTSAPPHRLDAASHLAHDAEGLGRALAEFTASVRRLSGENRCGRTEGDASAPRADTAVSAGPRTADARGHLTATEMGKARARLRKVAVDVQRRGDR